jgi:hypothetical protein
MAGVVVIPPHFQQARIAICHHAEELMILAQQLADLIAELFADRAREQ